MSFDWTTRPLEDELGEALRAELLGWPGVAIRPMMGCMAFVREVRPGHASASREKKPGGQARKPVPLQMLGCYVNRALSKKKPPWMNRPGEPPLVWVRLSPADAERALERNGIVPSRTGAKNWIEIPLETRVRLEEAVRWLGIAYEHLPRPSSRKRKPGRRQARKRLS